MQAIQPRARRPDALAQGLCPRQRPGLRSRADARSRPNARPAPRGGVRAVVLLGVAAGLAGCVPVGGHWRLVRAMPHREVFAIQDIRFDKSGSYTATVTLDGRTRAETGAYEQTFSKLHLLPAGGGRRSYTVNRAWNELHLMDGERKCILERTE